MSMLIASHPAYNFSDELGVAPTAARSAYNDVNSSNVVGGQTPSSDITLPVPNASVSNGDVPVTKYTRDETANTTQSPDDASQQDGSTITNPNATAIVDQILSDDLGAVSVVPTVPSASNTVKPSTQTESVNNKGDSRPTPNVKTALDTDELGVIKPVPDTSTVEPAATTDKQEELKPGTEEIKSADTAKKPVINADTSHVDEDESSDEEGYYYYYSNPSPKKREDTSNKQPNVTPTSSSYFWFAYSYARSGVSYAWSYIAWPFKSFYSYFWGRYQPK